ncbi:MAG: hypothetical protein MUF23_05070 [Pirellula sp.]|jgi:hypothetical protein|nr:hypothetical protein [Pirellula sp.]
MIPIDPIEATADINADATADIPLRAEEKGRIEDLLQRYNAILAQADRLNLQIESLLEEWNTNREQAPLSNS